MLIAIMRLIIFAFSAYGFYTALIWIEKKWSKKAALITSLIMGVFAIIGIILTNPN